MIRVLLRDPIARIAGGLWLAVAAMYFIPGVPPDMLARLGDRYSTMPLLPWAVAACLVGIANVEGHARQFWTLQGLSLGALLAIDIPWALAATGDSPVWSIAAEVCFFAYYGGQLASGARTARGAIGAAMAAAAACAVLSVLAVTHQFAYDDGWPSYLTYLAFDLTLVVVFWRRRPGARPAWRAIYTGLAATSALVFVTDVFDLLWYVGALPIDPGMKTDLLWTLPPLAYALVARMGRQRLAAEVSRAADTISGEVVSGSPSGLT